MPHFFWWQIPLSQFGVLLAHIAIVSVCICHRSKIRNISAVFLICSILNFYYSNWARISETSRNQGSIEISLGGKSSDLTVSFHPPGFVLQTKTLKLISDPVYSLNQDFGSVAIGQFEDIKGKAVTIAILETENLLSEQAWFGNNILMRRLTSILRQRKEPVVVILKANVAAGSPLIEKFMYQARLDVKASLNSWKTLIGMKAPLLLGRGLEFSRNPDSSQEEDFEFYFDIKN